MASAFFKAKASFLNLNSDNSRDNGRTFLFKLEAFKLAPELLVNKLLSMILMILSISCLEFCASAPVFAAEAKFNATDTRFNAAEAKSAEIKPVAIETKRGATAIKSAAIKSAAAETPAALEARLGIEVVTETPVGELFEAKVQAPEPVDGPDDQPKLIQQAFKDMLVRVSGSEKILNHATVVKALSAVDSYVTQFGFQINAKQERVLRVRFDNALCRELLKNAGQPLLVAKHPPVVLWLAMRQDNMTQWVSGEVQNELSHQLEILAEKRELTLVYPLLDLTDTALISEQHVWKEDLAALQAASKRYNADHMLIGKLSKQPNGWYAQWTYVKQGNSVRWDMSDTELAAVFGQSLDEFSNRLSSQEQLAAQERSKEGSNKAAGTELVAGTGNAALNAGKNAGNVGNNAGHVGNIGNTGNTANAGNAGSIGNAGNAANAAHAALKSGLSNIAENQSLSGQSAQRKTLRLAVMGVSGGEQYAKVLKYLKSLPAVNTVEVAEITSDQTIFNIDTTASREAIKNSIARDQLLMENNSGSLSESSAGNLSGNSAGNSSGNSSGNSDADAAAVPEATKEILNYKLVSLSS